MITHIIPDCVSVGITGVLIVVVGVVCVADIDVVVGIVSVLFIRKNIITVFGIFSMSTIEIIM